MADPDTGGGVPLAHPRLSFDGYVNRMAVKQGDLGLRNDEVRKRLTESHIGNFFHGQFSKISADAI